MLIARSIFVQASRFRPETDHSGCSGERFPWPSPLVRRRRTQCRLEAQKCELVGRHRQGQGLVDFLHFQHHCLADRANCLVPTGGLRDSLVLVERVSGISRRAAIDRTTSGEISACRN